MTESIFDSIKSLFKGKKKEEKIDVAGLEKLAKVDPMAFATALACLSDEEKQSIIKSSPNSNLAKGLQSYVKIADAAEKAGGL